MASSQQFKKLNQRSMRFGASSCAFFLALTVPMSNASAASTQSTKWDHAQKTMVPGSRFTRHFDDESVSDPYDDISPAPTHSASGSYSRPVLKAEAPHVDSPHRVTPKKIGNAKVEPPRGNWTTANNTVDPPSSSGLMRAQARIRPLVESGQFEKAQAVMTEYVNSHPRCNCFRGQFAKIAVANAESKLSTSAEAAATAARQALGADPKFQPGQEVLSQALTKMGLDPGNPADRLTLGSKLLGEGRNSEAAVEYGEALRLKPSAEAHTGLADAAWRSNRKDLAKLEYERAVQLDANYAPAQRQLGTMLYQQGDVVGANKALSKALITNPGDTDAANQLIGLWKEQVQHGTFSANNHLGLARAYQLAGQLKPAEEEYRQVVKLDPTNPKLPQARRSFKLAMQRQQAVQQIQVAHGLAQNGMLNEARQKCIEASTLNPTNPDVRLYQAQISQRCGAYSEARSGYEEVLRQNPHNEAATLGLNSLPNSPDLVASHTFPPIAPGSTWHSVAGGTNSASSAGNSPGTGWHSASASPNASSGSYAAAGAAGGAWPGATGGMGSMGSALPGAAAGMGATASTFPGAISSGGFSGGWSGMAAGSGTGGAYADTAGAGAGSVLAGIAAGAAQGAASALVGGGVPLPGSSNTANNAGSTNITTNVSAAPLPGSSSSPLYIQVGNRFIENGLAQGYNVAAPSAQGPQVQAMSSFAGQIQNLASAITPGMGSSALGDVGFLGGVSSVLANPAVASSGPIGATLSTAPAVDTSGASDALAQAASALRSAGVQPSRSFGQNTTHASPIFTQSFSNSNQAALNTNNSFNNSYPNIAYGSGAAVATGAATGVAASATPILDMAIQAVGGDASNPIILALQQKYGPTLQGKGAPRTPGELEKLYQRYKGTLEKRYGMKLPDSILPYAQSGSAAGLIAGVNGAKFDGAAGAAPVMGAGLLGAPIGTAAGTPLNGSAMTVPAMSGTAALAPTAPVAASSAPAVSPSASSSDIVSELGSFKNTAAGGPISTGSTGSTGATPANPGGSEWLSKLGDSKGNSAAATPDAAAKSVH